MNESAPEGSARSDREKDPEKIGVIVRAGEITDATVDDLEAWREAREEDDGL